MGSQTQPGKREPPSCLTDSYFDAEAVLYAERQSSNSWIGVQENLKARAMIASATLEKDARVLDAGCGSGPVLARLRLEGYRCTGADVSGRTLENARARLSEHGFSDVRLVQGDLARLPFDDGSFDGIFCAEVLEHLVDPPAVLTELMRLVRDGGRLVVSVPYREEIVWEICLHCGERTPRYGHLRNFDERSLSACLTAAGFAVSACFPILNRFTGGARFSAGVGRLPYSLWRNVDSVSSLLFRRNTLIAVGGKSPARLTADSKGVSHEG